MNGDDQIQVRRDEKAKWERELQEARKAFDEAVKAPHKRGQIRREVRAIGMANERICNAKFKLDWLRWCDEMDEGRWREETRA